MNQPICQQANHQAMKIISVCLHKDCKQIRLCCLQCVNQFHGGHNDKLIEIEQFNDFIQNQSNQQVKFPQSFSQAQSQMIQGLEQLSKLIDSFQQIVQQRLVEFRQSFQEYLKKIGSMQQGIDSLYGHIENILKYVEADNGVLTQKSQHQMINDMEEQQIKNIKQTEQSLLTLIQQFDPLSKMKKLTFSKNPFELIGHKVAVCQALISQDGSIIASGSSDKTIIVWDTKSKQQIMTIQHNCRVYRIALSSNNQYLAFSDSENYVKLYDLYQNKDLGVVKKTSEMIFSLIFSQDIKYFLFGGFNNRLTILSMINHREIHSFATNSLISKIIISPDNRLISCICTEQGQINIWDFQTKSKLIEENNTYQQGQDLCSSADSSIFISSGWGGLIKLWKLEELPNKKWLFTQINQIKDCSYVEHVILTKDEQYIISISNQEEKIMIHEKESLKLVQEIFYEHRFYFVKYISISNDMNTLVSTNNSNQINIWTRE